jgi:glycosyltransferase involved in cell wall biosynthesis
MAALALRLLADHALAMKITNNARQECERYRWDAVKNDWLKLYRELDRRHTGNQKQLVPGSEVAPG